MGSKEHRDTQLAVELVLSTGATPQVAADTFGLAVTTVRRAMARAGVAANPVGRPPAKQNQPKPRRRLIGSVYVSVNQGEHK